MHLYSFKSNGRQMRVSLWNPKPQFSVSAQEHLGHHSAKAINLLLPTIKSRQRRYVTFDFDQKWDSLLCWQLHPRHQRCSFLPRALTFEASFRPRSSVDSLLSVTVQIYPDWRWHSQGSFGLLRQLFQVVQTSTEIKVVGSFQRLWRHFHANDR